MDLNPASVPKLLVLGHKQFWNVLPQYLCIFRAYGVCGSHGRCIVRECDLLVEEQHYLTKDGERAGIESIVLLR